MTRVPSLAIVVALYAATCCGAEPAAPRATTATTASAAAAAAATASAKNVARATTMKDLLAATKPGDWRLLDPDHTLYLELSVGRVVIELNPAFAPRHVTNIETLTRAHWYDGLAVTRVQDNFVVQWGDPLNGKPEIGERRLPAEFTRAGAALPFTRLKDPDTFAPEVGFSNGFPVARTESGEAWLVHCYGMVGVGRDTDPATAIGTELYAVLGQAPRQLDRNVTVVGRVVWGMELLSSLPRGTGELGVYEQPEQRVPIQTVRLATEIQPSERSALEALKTDTPAFERLIEIRRNRKDSWYKVPAGHIDICNVPLPVRMRVEPKPEKRRA